MNRWCQKCGKKFTPVGAENKCPDCTGVTIKPKKVKAEDGPEPDMVNHPPHYKLPNGSDAIDVIRAVLTPEEYRGWCKGNALKYQLRAGKKDPTKLVQDLQKAGFFLKELEIYG